MLEWFREMGFIGAICTASLIVFGFFCLFCEWLAGSAD